MSEEKKGNSVKIEICPHCGEKLSPWQQVLLSVDRAVMCKNCWYRIILSTTEPENPEVKNKSKDEDE